jgi:cell wall-associated NlpC family hydrolase
MWFRVFTVIILAVVLGCRPHPRFRTGGEERPVRNESRQPIRLTTNDSLRLGLIMQGFLGKPYSGRSSYETGLDCSHFVFKVFNKFDGRKLPRRTAEQYRSGSPVLRRHLMFGDLVFFSTDGRPISHVGIFVGSGEFIHASSSRGVIISKLSEKYWSKCYVGGRRILEQPARDDK